MPHFSHLLRAKDCRTKTPEHAKSFLLRFPAVPHKKGCKKTQNEFFYTPPALAPKAERSRFATEKTEKTKARGKPVRIASKLSRPYLPGSRADTGKCLSHRRRCRSKKPNGSRDPTGPLQTLFRAGPAGVRARTVRIGAALRQCSVCRPAPPTMARQSAS